MPLAAYGRGCGEALVSRSSDIQSRIWSATCGARALTDAPALTFSTIFPALPYWQARWREGSTPVLHRLWPGVTPMWYT